MLFEPIEAEAKKAAKLLSENTNFVKFEFNKKVLCVAKLDDHSKINHLISQPFGSFELDGTVYFVFR